MTTLTQASLTLQTARSHPPRFAPDLSITHGHRYQGPRRLPGPNSHRQAIVNLSLLRHVVLLFLMAPEQSRRTATLRKWAGRPGILLDARAVGKPREA